MMPNRAADMRKAPCWEPSGLAERAGSTSSRTSGESCKFPRCAMADNPGDTGKHLVNREVKFPEDPTESYPNYYATAWMWFRAGHTVPTGRIDRRDRAPQSGELAGGVRDQLSDSMWNHRGDADPFARRVAAGDREHGRGGWRTSARGRGRDLELHA